MAALKAYKKHEGKAEDTSRQVQEYIVFAASLDPKKYWAGIRHERWITNRWSKLKQQAYDIKRLVHYSSLFMLPAFSYPTLQSIAHHKYDVPTSYIRYTKFDKLWEIRVRPE